MRLIASFIEFTAPIIRSFAKHYHQSGDNLERLMTLLVELLDNLRADNLEKTRARALLAAVEVLCQKQVLSQYRQLHQTCREADSHKLSNAIIRFQHFLPAFTKRLCDERRGFQIKKSVLGDLPEPAISSYRPTFPTPVESRSDLDPDGQLAIHSFSQFFEHVMPSRFEAFQYELVFPISGRQYLVAGSVLSLSHCHYVPPRYLIEDCLSGGVVQVKREPLALGDRPGIYPDVHFSAGAYRKACAFDAISTLRRVIRVGFYALEVGGGKHLEAAGPGILESLASGACRAMQFGSVPEGFWAVLRKILQQAETKSKELNVKSIISGCVSLAALACIPNPDPLDSGNPEALAVLHNQVSRRYPNLKLTPIDGVLTSGQVLQCLRDYLTLLTGTTCDYFPVLYPGESYYAKVSTQSEDPELEIGLMIRRHLTQAQLAFCHFRLDGDYIIITLRDGLSIFEVEAALGLSFQAVTQSNVLKCMRFTFETVAQYKAALALLVSQKVLESRDVTVSGQEVYLSSHAHAGRALRTLLSQTASGQLKVVDEKRLKSKALRRAVLDAHEWPSLIAPMKTGLHRLIPPELHTRMSISFIPSESVFPDEYKYAESCDYPQLPSGYYVLRIALALEETHFAFPAVKTLLQKATAQLAITLWWQGIECQIQRHLIALILPQQSRHCVYAYVPSDAASEFIWALTPRGDNRRALAYVAEAYRAVIMMQQLLLATGEDVGASEFATAVSSVALSKWNQHFVQHSLNDLQLATGKQSSKNAQSLMVKLWQFGIRPRALMREAVKAGALESVKLLHERFEEKVTPPLVERSYLLEALTAGELAVLDYLIAEKATLHFDYVFALVEAGEIGRLQELARLTTVTYAIHPQAVCRLDYPGGESAICQVLAHPNIRFLEDKEDDKQCNGLMRSLLNGHLQVAARLHENLHYQLDYVNSAGMTVKQYLAENFCDIVAEAFAQWGSREYNPYDFYQQCNRLRAAFAFLNQRDVDMPNNKRSADLRERLIRLKTLIEEREPKYQRKVKELMILLVSQFEMRVWYRGPALQGGYQSRESVMSTATFSGRRPAKHQY